MAAQDCWPAQSRSSDSGACAGCHPAQSKNYLSNGMSNALQRAESSDILRTNAGSNSLKALIARISRAMIRFDIDGDGRQGYDSSAPSCGRLVSAAAGQTYVFEHAGTMFESRVSYYDALKRSRSHHGSPRFEARDR